MTRFFRIAALVLIDAACVNLSFFLGFLLRFELDTGAAGFSEFFPAYTENFLWLTAIKLFILFLFGMYGSLWKYASAKELFKVLIASVFATLAAMGFLTLVQGEMPRSVFAFSFLLDTAMFGGVRFAYRYAREMKRKDSHSGIVSVFSNEPDSAAAPANVMIVGAGDAGASIIREIRYNSSSNKRAVVAIDDDASKRGQNILGVRIVGGRESIAAAVEKYRVDEIIIAIPSATKKEIGAIVSEAGKTRAKIQTLPSMMDLIDGNVSINDLRDLDIEDLLGRDPVELDMESISGYLNDRVILVTGGGGSIGSELCRQIAGYNPGALIAVDIYENTVFELENELKRTHPELRFEPVIASVTDAIRMRHVFDAYRPQVVFHAAAHKHVPLMEDNPGEAILNNVIGTKMIVDFAAEYGVEKFVMISTDKAVNPENVMGATKRLAEMVVQHKSRTRLVGQDDVPGRAQLAAGDSFPGCAQLSVESEFPDRIQPEGSASSGTSYAAVRFGNVLGSNGSVVPIFRKQIEDGGPVTVTDRNITRYFMTIPEAVQLVIQAGSMMNGGEIFILDMGEPVSILTLAENIIRLSGFIPYEDIDIKFTGLRPGEKMYEELSYAEEDLSKTAHEKIFLGSAMPPSGRMSASLEVEDTGSGAVNADGQPGMTGAGALSAVNVADKSAADSLPDGGLESIICTQVSRMSDDEAKQWLHEYLPEYRGWRNGEKA